MKDLVGKIIKTKEGIDVKIIAYCPELDQPLIGIMNGGLEQWGIDGRWIPQRKFQLDLDLDLEE